MNTDIPTWGLFVLGGFAGLLGSFMARYSSKLLRGKSIKEVVDSANAIIEMYEKHVGALELKVGELEKQVAGLKATLEETLQHNTALQKLLMASPAMTIEAKKE